MARTTIPTTALDIIASSVADASDQVRYATEALQTELRALRRRCDSELASIEQGLNPSMEGWFHSQAAKVEAAEVAVRLAWDAMRRAEALASRFE